MKKLLLGLLILAFGIPGTAQSPFVVFPAEQICDGGTKNYDVPITASFEKGLLIRLNIFGTPADSLIDTTKVMISTRFTIPDQSGLTGIPPGIQAWSAFPDSFLAATDDTATVELWFPIDSLITGYDGVTLGDLLRFTFTTTDTVAATWCTGHNTSLKFQVTLGYF